MIVPGLVHDHCSAFHPIAAASPFLTGLNLGSEGLTWAATSGRLCASAGRRIGRSAVPIDRPHRGRYGERRSEMASSVRADHVALRRLVRRRVAAGAPRTATSVHVVALRQRRHAAGHHAGSALEDGRGQGTVVRGGRPRLLSARPTHDERGWFDADHRRARRGVGGGERRFSGDRRGPGGRYRTPRRPDRDRADRDVGRCSAAQRCADAGRVAIGRGRHPRRPVAGPGRPRVPSIPSRARRVQGRLCGRARRALDRACGPARPARCTSAAISTRWSPTRWRCTAGRCRTDRSCSSASNISPTRAGRWATSTPCGPMRTCPTAMQATPPTPSSPRSSDSPRGSGNGSWARRCARRRRCRCTTELRRWRRHRRCVLADTTPVPSTVRDRPVLHRDPRDLPVFGVDTAGSRRARHVRRQRRRRRAGTAWLLNPGSEMILESSFQLGRESARLLRHIGLPR